MRLFGGLSGGIGRARVGVSRRGRPWVGARAGTGAPYLGVIAGGKSSSRSRRRAEPEKSSLAFTVEDDGTVKLGDGVVDVEALRAVVRASDEAKERGKR